MSLFLFLPSQSPTHRLKKKKELVKLVKECRVSNKAFRSCLQLQSKTTTLLRIFLIEKL